MSKWFYIVLYVILFLLLQIGYSYHFFYLEQFQLFMFSDDYLLETVCRPGGLSIYLGEFLVQFFYYPLVGAIISAFILVCITGFIFRLSQAYRPFNKNIFFLEVLVPLFLLIDILDFNFIYGGLVSFLFCVSFLVVNLYIKNDYLRIGVGCLMICLMFLITGSFFVIFAVSLFIQEMKVHRLKISLLFVPVIFVLLLIFYLDRSGWLFYSDVLFFADEIYSLKGGAGWIIYIPWVLLVFSPFLFPCFDIFFVRINNMHWNIGIRVVLWLISCTLLLSAYDDRKSLPVKKYSYYADRNKWEEILHCCKKQKPTDLLCLNYQNLALSEKGILADSLLAFTQQGSRGLFVDWNMTPFVSMTLQKICYNYGDMASARKYAFECNVCARSVGYPETLKMLATSNWALGEFAVAEKYLSYLHKTWVYRHWKIDSLSLKQFKAKTDNFVYRQDMDQLAYDNVHDKKLADFVLCSYLLDKNLNEFLQAYYYFYKDEKRVPLIYQEAILLGAQSNPRILDYFSVSDSLKVRFDAYLSQTKSNRSNMPRRIKDDAGISYSRSYWYYFDFIPVRL